MSKYIIKNCPCIIEFKNMYFCAELNNVDELKQLCQDCTDCVMKRIKSKLDYLKCYINNDDLANLSKMNEIIDDTLKLLDI